MNLTDYDIRQFQDMLEHSFKPIAERLYPEYMRQYDRYRTRVGPHCAFCRAAAKHIMAAEIARKGIDFITRFKTNSWIDYE